MDRHLIDAFLESIIDYITERVAQRLSLRPPVKAVDRSLPPETPAVVTAVPGTALSEYLSPDEVATLLQVSKDGLQKMRSEGRGPKFVKVGGRVRYRRSELP